MNILIVTSEFGPYINGGLGVHVDQLISGLIEVGIHVTVAFASTSLVSIIVIDRNGNPRWIFTQPLEKKEDKFESQEDANNYLAEVVKQHFILGSFDLIHSHSWVSFRAGLRLAKHYGLPHIVTVHILQTLYERGRTIEDRTVHKIEQEMFSKADYIIAVSDCIKDMICNIEPSANSKVVRIYNWVNDDDLNSASNVTIPTLRFTSHEEEQIVLFVGRLNYQKGLELLIESSYRVRMYYPKTRWLIIGPINSYYKKKYAQYINGADGCKHIEFLGEQPRKSLGEFYRAAHCLVVPSIFEPFGLVAIEAMVMGTPIIVSDIDGLREIVDNEVNGICVPFDFSQVPQGPNIELLARAQMRILSDYQLRSRFSTAAKEKIKSIFSKEKVFPQIIELYKRAMELRNHSH